MTILGRLQGVEHEGYNGHWADTTRDRGDEGGKGCDLVEGNVPREPKATLARGVRYTCCPNVYDHCPWAYHICP